MDEVSIKYQCWHCSEEFPTLYCMEQHLNEKHHGSIYILKQYVNGNLAGEQIGSMIAMRQAHAEEMLAE